MWGISSKAVYYSSLLDEWEGFWKHRIESRLLYYVCNEFLKGDQENTLFHSDTEKDLFKWEIKLISTRAGNENDQHLKQLFLEFMRITNRRFLRPPISDTIQVLWGHFKTSYGFEESAKKIIEQLPYTHPLDMNQEWSSSKALTDLIHQYFSGIKTDLLKKRQDALQVYPPLQTTELLSMLFNIQCYYEHYRYPVGFLCGCFDLIYRVFDENLQTYMSDEHYPNEGLYSKTRRVQKGKKLIKDPSRNNLETYLKIENYPVVQDEIARIISYSALRNFVAHRLLSDTGVDPLNNTIKAEGKTYSFEDLFQIQHNLFLGVSRARYSIMEYYGVILP